MVGDAIEQRGGHLGIAECPHPFGEGEVVVMISEVFSKS